VTYSDLGALCVGCTQRLEPPLTMMQRLEPSLTMMQRLEPSLTMVEGAGFAYLSRLERWYFSDFVRLDI
jgi:hypothetical protein